MSRALIRRAPSLLWRNGNLPLLLAALYAGVGAIVGVESFASGRVVIAVVAVFAATLAFTRERTKSAVAAAVVHAGLHGGLILAVLALVSEGLPRLGWLAVVGGTLGVFAMGVAMLFAATIGINENELFSAIRVDDYRCFLRMRVDPNEMLTIYPIGVDKTQRRWHPCEATAACPSRLEPDQPVVARLIEPPISIVPASVNAATNPTE